MIEMHHMVVDELRRDHDVADELGVRGNLVSQSELDGAHRCDAVNHRAHAAESLREGPGIAWIAAVQDQFDATHHGAGTRRAGDDAGGIGVRFDPEMPFDAGYRVNDDARHRTFSPSNRTRLARTALCRSHRGDPRNSAAHSPDNRGRNTLENWSLGST